MRAFVRALAAPVFAALLLFSGAALAGQVEVQWLGHATTRIITAGGKTIVIDPFITKNPTTPAELKDLSAFGAVDLILITHGHSDHVADLGELARLSGAKVVANYELALQLAALGVIGGDKAIGMNKSGTVTPLGPDIKVHMVPAEHSSSVDLPGLGLPLVQENGQRFLDAGASVGYVVELENGFKIYHSGDTGIFGDMALIHELHAPDLALVCIGGHFTMDPAGAAYAVRELLKPKQVIPIHYGTYPIIDRTPAEFKAALGDTTIKVLDVSPGQTLKF
jgi:L-ascorbate metabolism protein UlaG (beta-lactamase superfamily)